ncbi:MAG TPA: response regulator transcription factor, partial [Streptosporangiaceae bacterium]
VSALKVIVAEDHTLVREGVVRVLEQGGCVVAAVAGDARELVRKAGMYHPDVVIADIRLPPNYDDDGIRAALEIRAAAPEISVIVLSQFLEDRYVLDLVGGRPGGVGYLLKEKIASPGVLIDAVRRVAAGGSALDPDVIARLVARKRADGPLGDLTPRERDVLSLMAEGWSNVGIAEKLYVTVPAVERHVTRIFSKLGLQQSSTSQHRRVLAVLKYLQN